MSTEIHRYPWRGYMFDVSVLRRRLEAQNHYYS